MCFVLTRDYSQEPFFPTIDWVDSVDDWTIDGTHLVVRVRGDYYYVGAHVSGFARRDLNNNQLTSSIPSTIGQLTALTVLYVFVLTIQCRSSRFSLRTQVPQQQPVVKFDSDDDWSIDGTHFIVRVLVDYHGVGGSRFWLRTQDSFRQPVDKLDSVDDWTIYGTPVLVRVRVDYSVSELTLLASHAGIFPATS
jgi:hypothetical protein